MVDALVFERWNTLHDDDSDGNVFRTYVTDFEFKAIPGSCNFQARYNRKHWEAKRKDANALKVDFACKAYQKQNDSYTKPLLQVVPDAPDVPLEEPFNPDRFHFGKIRSSEIMGVLQAYENGTIKFVAQSDAEADAIDSCGNGDNSEDGTSINCSLRPARACASHTVAVNVSPLFTGKTCQSSSYVGKCELNNAISI